MSTSLYKACLNSCLSSLCWRQPFCNVWLQVVGHLNLVWAVGIFSRRLDNLSCFSVEKCVAGYWGFKLCMLWSTRRFAFLFFSPFYRARRKGRGNPSFSSLKVGRSSCLVTVLQHMLIIAIIHILDGIKTRSRLLFNCFHEACLGWCHRPA